MAVDIEETIRLLEAALARATASGSDPAELAAMSKAISEFRSRLLEAGGKLKKYSENMNEAMVSGTKSYSQNNKALKKEIDDQIRHIRATANTAEELEEGLNELKEKFKDISHIGVRQSILSQIDSTNRLSAVQEKYSTLVKAVTPTFAALGSATSKVLGAYQSGSGQIGMSAAALEGAVGAAGAGVGLLGTGLTAGGQALGNFGNKYVKAAGKSLEVFGSAASIAGSAISAVGQKVLPFLQAELTKNIDAFQSLSSSGAMFAGGLTEMVQTAGRAGLTLTQLDNVVKNNKDSLSGLGESLTGGAKKLSSVLETGGKGFKKELLDMGFAVEEQAGLVADTMRSMRQSGSALTASNPEILAQTKKYAENLRIVSDITGEDAKKKMEEIKKQNQRLAFQQAISDLTEGQRTALERAQLNMSGLQKEAFQQMVAMHGAITDPELAAAVAQTPALKQSLDEMYSKFKDKTLDETGVRDIQDKYGAQIKEQLMAQTGIAQAGIANIGGLIGGIEKRYGDELEFRNRFTESARKQAEQGTAGQAEGKDPLQNAMTKMIADNQAMLISTQNAILKSEVMTSYAELSSKVTTELTKMIDAVANNITPTTTWGDKIKENIPLLFDLAAALPLVTTALGTLGTWATGAVAGTAATAAATLAGTFAAAMAPLALAVGGGAAAFYGLQKVSEAIENDPNMAKMKDRNRDKTESQIQQEAFAEVRSKLSGGRIAAPTTTVTGGPVSPGAATASATIDERKAFLKDREDEKIPTSMTFPEWKAKKDKESTAATPVTPAASAIPINPIAPPTATPTAESVFGPGGLQPLTQQQREAAGVDESGNRIVPTNTNSEDKSKEQLDAIRKQTALFEDIHETLREMCRYSRTTAEAM